MIINGFLQSDKFTALYEALASRGEAHGLCLELKTNIDLMADAATGRLLSCEEESMLNTRGEARRNDEPNTKGSAGWGTQPKTKAEGFGIFWDKDVRLAGILEGRGMRLFNSARCIELCDDKSLTHIALMGKVPQPKTVVVPLTFPRIGYTRHDFLDEIGGYLGFPLVIKECFGSFGAQVYLAHNREQARELLVKTAGSPVLAQEYVSSSAGRDLRLYVVGGKVTAAILRENTHGDFRANVAQGGRATAYAPTREQERVALRAAELLGCDFAGVDLLFGKDGQPLLLEVNSNAHFAGISQATGVNVADAIVAHVARSLTLE